jgi:hypothetical protein
MLLRIPSNKEVVSVLLTALLSIQARATTVVVLVSKQGISLAADSKEVFPHRGYRDVIKSVVIQDRIAIASLGCAEFEMFTSQGIISKYDFGAWMREIESKLPLNVPVDDFSAIVKDEVGKMIPQWQLAVSSGKMQHNSSDQIFEPLVEYVIAGYRDGVPVLSVIQLDVDWDGKKVLGPYQTPFDLGGPIRNRLRLEAFGVTQAIANIMDSKSYANQEAMARCPKACGDLITGHGDITLNKTRTFARVLIEIEEKVSPNLVGGRVRIIEITPTGGAHDLTGADSLPKAKTGEKKKEPGQ